MAATYDGAKGTEYILLVKDKTKFKNNCHAYCVSTKILYFYWVTLCDTYSNRKTIQNTNFASKKKERKNTDVERMPYTLTHTTHDNWLKREREHAEIWTPATTMVTPWSPDTVINIIFVITTQHGY